ncbi:MAG: hypothetical protein HY852_04935 [Bradyrhizobium sp.]|uniref:hypothetical protein n=1 Tax=Bradyrhizobium sp. TaxID=376 RepID=UPI0025BFC040|nr:hypothetical protein [Bradyrhizobium sp.]MBI5261146.1 hypothetical protein [Bradyrhizobium sp.]
MSGDSSIAETLKEEVAEIAKAVAADVKAIAAEVAEVAEAVAEGTAELCGDGTSEEVAASPPPAIPSRADEVPGTGRANEQK